MYHANFRVELMLSKQIVQRLHSVKKSEYNISGIDCVVLKSIPCSSRIWDLVFIGKYRASLMCSDMKTWFRMPLRIALQIYLVYGVQVWCPRMMADGKDLVDLHDRGICKLEEILYLSCTLWRGKKYQICVAQCFTIDSPTCFLNGTPMLSTTSQNSLEEIIIYSWRKSLRR